MPMDSRRSRQPASWFRSRSGRRFGIEFAAVVVIKLVALVVLWFVCFRPHPRPDTAPTAVERHLFAPTSGAADDR
jgi:hypothetical protein